MRRTIGVLLIAALPLLMSPAASATAHPAMMKKKATVHIVNFAFKKTPLSVTVGTTVKWKNTTTTTTHTSTSDTGVWNSGPIAPGATFSFKFTTTGTFTYHCSIHPFMTAEIDVTP